MHALRGTVDAIIVGVGTVLADDPQLTARDLRDGSLAIRQPLRVVVDTRGPYPGRRPGPRRRRADLDRHRRRGRRRPGRPGRPARAARPSCTTGACRAVLLEGGPTLAGAFLRAGLVDRVVGYLAPKLLGAGPAALADAGVDHHRRGHRPGARPTSRRIGPDLRFTALPTEAGRS